MSFIVGRVALVAPTNNDGFKSHEGKREGKLFSNSISSLSRAISVEILNKLTSSQ